jgi:uncharacterized protein
MMLRSVVFVCIAQLNREGSIMRLKGKQETDTCPIYVFTIAVLLTVLSMSAAPGQSFNCRTAERSDEVLICQNSRLSSLDEQMSNLYFTLRNQLSGSERRALEAGQRRWLQSRIDCGRDFGCIEDLYERRIRFLRNY